MRRGLSSFLAVWISAALFGLAFESTGALAAAGSSHASRQSASQRSVGSQPARRSGTRTPGMVTTAPGEGYGSRDGAAPVRALQRRLARAGDASGPIDGRYGPLTERAVQRFQATHGLQIDGIAGPQTLAAWSTPAEVLLPGSGYRSRDGSAPVRALQRRLARAGDAPGPIDGRYGPLTERAVRRFQATHGLQIDGIAGPRTLGGLSLKGSSRRQLHRRSRPQRSRPTATSRRSGSRHARPPAAHHRPPAQAPATAHHARHSAGSSLWLILLAGVLLALLAGMYALRRRSPSMSSDDLNGGTAAALSLDRGGEEPTPGFPQAPPLGVEDEFERAAERAEAVIAFNTAVRLEDQHDRAGARAAYQHAERAGHAGAATNLGVMMELDGDVEGARAAYARADRRGDANGAFNLGCLLDEQGDTGGALDAYQRADQRGHAQAATNLGVLMEVRGNIANARAAYQRAEQRGDPNGAANLGALLEEHGKRGAAKAAYRRAKRLRMSPGHEPARGSSHEPGPSEERSPEYARRGNEA